MPQPGAQLTYVQLLDDTRAESQRLQQEVKDLNRMVDQSRVEVEKLAQRNAAITAHVRQMQTNLEAVPRADIKTAYEAENKERFKKFGVEKEKDKQPFGAESLFPKMGFGLTLAIPYFEGTSPLSDLQTGKYLGQPMQRYLKIAWAYSKDNKLDVEQKLKAKQHVPPKMAALAAVHKSVEAKLDGFITSLVVDGHLGDELVKKKNAALLAPLAKFANAFAEGMMRMAASESSSRLSVGERLALSGSGKTTEAQKMKLFSEWRDFSFEDNVKAATKRGVRFAGMGQAHLDHLVAVGLEKNQHPFEMDGKDIAAFKALTDKLKKAAKP